MVSAGVRTLVCAFVGLAVGAVLGPLFVPDPTSGVAGALAVVVELVVGGGLYATWGRSDARSE